MDRRAWFACVIGGLALAGLGVALLLKGQSTDPSLTSDGAADPDALLSTSDAQADRRNADDAHASDDELEVKELALGDGGIEWNQKSIRVMHPDLRVQQRLREWLEPQEKGAVARNASLSCNADTATRTLVSLTCVSLSKWEPDDASPAGEQGGSANPVYSSLTMRVSGDGGFKALTLSEVLKPGIGEKEVVEACKKVADPPFPCAWPPTSFSIVRGDSLFICHDHSCVDIDEEAGLLRPDLTAPLAH